MSLKAKPYLSEVFFRDPAGIDFSNYPWNIPAVRAIDHLRFHADVTFLVGANGSGSHLRSHRRCLDQAVFHGSSFYPKIMLRGIATESSTGERRI